eukprot:TRINITY_DN11506_c0_g1_i1.p1 TRINITY_DN11506_c0_g1~~TRINITY_DN11506_c0_g1_i1.p1  ORF type:complete len:141 (+),score=29.35 TRINITY_DN11506_c0_g1_i1:101-523(+)
MKNVIPLDQETLSENSSFSEVETTPGSSILTSPCHVPAMPLARGGMKKRRPMLASLCGKEAGANPFSADRRKENRLKCTEYLQQLDNLEIEQFSDSDATGTDCTSTDSLPVREGPTLKSILKTARQQHEASRSRITFCEP